jgi:type II secretory pathway component PulF
MGTRYRGFIENDSSSRVCAVADTLAWAATHSIPFDEALRGMDLVGKPGMGAWRAVLWSLSYSWPFFLLLIVPDPDVVSIVLATVFIWWPIAYLTMLPFQANSKWAALILGVADELEKGTPLGSAMSRRLKGRFPDSYLAAVLHAEQEGTLESILPVLAEQFRYPYEIRRIRWRNVAPYIGYAVFCAFVIFFLSMFIAPKLDEIFQDMGQGSMRSMFPLNCSPRGLIGLLILLPVVGFLLPVISPAVRRSLIALPWIGREQRDAFQIDLARLICVYTARGKDVGDAARIYLELTKSRWIRKRLSGFLAALEAGRSWTEAWETMGVGTPFETWVLRNAAAREEPASGFELLVQWGQMRTIARTRALQLWFVPLVVLWLGYMVGRFGVDMFMNFRNLVITLTSFQS